MKLTQQMKDWKEEGASYREIARRLGVHNKTVLLAFGRVKKWGKNSVQKKQQSIKDKTKKTNVRTLNEFRKEHDQTWKIRDGIKRLFKNGVYMTDAEFRDAVCGSSTRWRLAADAPEFAPYRYKVQGVLYWASENTIREMRKIRGEAV